VGDTRAATKAVNERRTGYIVTKDSLARWLGYSISWIEKAIKAGAPVTYKGRSGVPAKIDSAEFLQWMLDQEREKIEKKYRGIVGDSTSEEEAKRRLSLARAEREEIMLRRLRGEVIDTTVMERVLSKAIADTRALLLSIPTKMAPVLAMKTDIREVQAELKTAIYGALGELSGININRFVDEEMLQLVGATAETDSERVGGPEQETES